LASKDVSAIAVLNVNCGEVLRAIFTPTANPYAAGGYLMRESRPVLWQEAFIKAVDEPDRETLARLIREAERAIILRRQQLDDPANYRDEVRAMNLATLAMDAIRVQKLGGSRNRTLLKDCCSFQKTA
jgi:hypothetical protein